MPTYNIVVFAGDYAGPEVCAKFPSVVTVVNLQACDVSIRGRGRRRDIAICDRLAGISMEL